MPHTIENLLVRDILDSMTGLKNVEQVPWILVFHHREWKMQKKCYTQWEELLLLMTQLPLLCTGKLMETMLLENKRTETTTGNSIQQSTDLVSVRRKFWTELPLLFIMRDMMNNSQKLSSSKKLLKIIKQLHLTCLDTLRISVKAKLIEELNSYMVLRMWQVETIGMLPDVFMESQLKKKCNQIMIWANQLSQIAETLLERRKTNTDLSVAQLSEKIFHSKLKIKRVLLITKTTVMNQRLLICYSHRIILSLASKKVTLDL